MCSTTNISDIKSINTLGIHHLGLTVSNLQETAAFFIDQLNFEKVGGKPDYPAIFVSDGSIMLTLWQAKNAEKAVPFNRQHNVGLHHFALKVADIDQLNKLHQQLSKLENVEVEFAPEQLAESPFHHMMCLIPGGIRLELISA